jgi:hypothetical protein
MFVSENEELTFGTLDPQAIAQPSCEQMLPGPTTLQTLAFGRDPRDQLRIAGIASTKRRNA